MSLAFLEEHEESEDKLVRAKELLGNWTPDVKQYPNESEGKSKMNNEFLSLANPEEFLAEILEFLPEIEDTEVANSFKEGLKKITNVSENGSLGNVAEELSRNLARIILGFIGMGRSPYTNKIIKKMIDPQVLDDPKYKIRHENETVEIYKKKIISLVKAINKALAARTFNYKHSLRADKERISAQVRATIYEKEDNSSNRREFTGKYLKEMTDERSEKYDPAISKKAKSLLDRLQKIQEEKGKYYDPHLFLIESFIDPQNLGSEARLTQAEILNLIEDQIDYLEGFSGRNEERINKINKEEREKKEILENKISESTEELEASNSKIVSLKTHIVTKRRAAETEKGRLSESLEITKKSLEEIKSKKKPGFFGKKQYIEDILRDLNGIIIEIRKIEEKREKIEWGHNPDWTPNLAELKQEHYKNNSEELLEKTKDMSGKNKGFIDEMTKNLDEAEKQEKQYHREFEKLINTIKNCQEKIKGLLNAVGIGGMNKKDAVEKITPIMEESIKQIDEIKAEQIL